MHVLVVDDEWLVVETLQLSLEDVGYRVTAAVSGPEALAADDRDPADVLVTDFRMPGMTGKELLDRMRLRRPRLPAVVVSGYSAEAIGITSDERTVFLDKPVSPRALARTIAGLVA